MEEHADPQWTTITGYLQGDCSPAEREQLERWLAGSPERRAMLERLEWSWQRIEPASQAPFDAARFKQGVLARVAQAAPLATRRTRAGGRSWRRWMMGTGVAAVAALGVLFASSRLAPDRTVFTGPEYVTAFREQRSFTLPDGSQVQLAPGSALRLSAAFGAADRTMLLTGEAYFHVAPGAGHPFTIHTGNARTTVLGTEFNVRQYDRESATYVAVRSGKVSAQTEGGEAVTLASGMVGVVNDSGARVAPHADAASYDAWTRGELVFKATPAVEVLRTIGRWYDFDFHLSDSTIAGMRVTTVLQIANTQETLNALKRLLGVTMTFDGKSVTLVPDTTSRVRQITPGKILDRMPVTTALEVRR